MKSPWPSGNAMTYESTALVESRSGAGVTFTVAKMSFARRVELMRRVRELAGRLEFLEAGAEPGGKMDAALLRAEIDRLYLAVGAEGAFRGWTWTGAAATPELLAESGAGGPLSRGPRRRCCAETGLNEEAAKKLLVAFHFHFANQAGWKCDDCRRTGLENKRRCGWAGLGGDESGAPGVGAAAGMDDHLPAIVRHSAESQALVEEFLVAAAPGRALRFEELSAKQVEAFRDFGEGTARRKETMANTTQDTLYEIFRRRWPASRAVAGTGRRPSRTAKRASRGRSALRPGRSAGARSPEAGSAPGGSTARADRRRWCS